MCIFDIRHHPHLANYPCAKFCLCCVLYCWASPWKKIMYSITYSLTHSAYLMPREPKPVLRNSKRKSRNSASANKWYLITGLPGDDVAAPATAEQPAVASLCSSSWVKPFRANGAGSTPRRMNRSASDAKHRSAPSATWRQSTHTT